MPCGSEQPPWPLHKSPSLAPRCDCHKCLHVATCPVGNLYDSPALPLTGLNKQVLVGYLWNEQPRAVETMAQVPLGTAAGDGGQTVGAAQNPGQGDGELEVGLQPQVIPNPASSWPGLEQGRSGDIYLVFIIQ